VDIQINAFLISALVAAEWLASRPQQLYPREIALGTLWIREWVGPIIGLDDVGRRRTLSLPGLEVRTVGSPKRSPSLYRLSYPPPNLLKLYFKVQYNFLSVAKVILECRVQEYNWELKEEFERDSVTRG
jgi:hypothetical protein